MAQLKDLIVTGASQLIGNAQANNLQLTTVNAPTSSGGTTYSTGNDGQVLKTNGSSVYWGDAITSSYAVTAGWAITASRAITAAYAVTAGFATTATRATTSGYAITASQATHAASANTATTAGFATTASQATTAGNASVAGKLGTAGVGSSVKPIYLASGVATAGERMFPVYYSNVDFTSTAPVIGAYPMNTTNPVTEKTEYGSVLNLPGIGESSAHYGAQVLVSASSGQASPVHMYLRRLTDTPSWSNWTTVLDDGNYTTYTVKKDGTGASGTWNITATTAQQATHAATAGSATTASQATHSATANTATTAGFATTASQATHAATANTATTADFATTASQATTAGAATTASQATHAATANTAATAGYATTAARAGTAGFAITASRATTAGNATDATKVLKAGDTMTGNLTISKSAPNIYLTDTANNNITLRLIINSNHQNHGLYSSGFAPTSSTYTATAAYIIYRGADGEAHTGLKLYGAVWNDYAEYREVIEPVRPGQCIIENGDDTMSLSTERLQKGCEIVSDTYGFAVGKTDKAQTPTAASGRVLAYLYEDRDTARQHIGDPVCSGPGGTVSIMTELEELKYPSRIIGTISSVPDYETWTAGTEETPIDVKVDGRVWIRIR